MSANDIINNLARLLHTLEVNYATIINNCQQRVADLGAEIHQILYNAFGDSNPIINSESSIRALRQVGSVACYATDFRRLSMKLTWNNDALVSQFVLNLKNHVKDVLARLPPIQKLNVIIAKSIKIDNRQFARLHQKQKTSARITRQPPPMEINHVGYLSRTEETEQNRKTTW
ncbi:hypothetical protein INT47_004392 [Mucor saturninus]|uniref:Retrotransposon gag domain-containing protein n=1 Tax=Mucor saturninus TaxID=64648 RepID=A0A8H7R0W6_9FUNG|nr:hypothetical protein INT47_004392 [Mucor saturninus]